MKQLRGEACGLCGGRSVTYQTDTMQVLHPDEVLRGVRIVRRRYQRRRCRTCGAEGYTPVFIGVTDWQENDGFNRTKQN